jgi:lipopolysaccharide transport system ATP-binding protein
MGIAIKVEDLGKAYQLGEIGTGTLSHDLERYWAKLRGKEDPFLKIGETNDRTTKGTSDMVWSLKDLNFEIEQGDAVGIIGRNGAGKSTLLKILSRVTSPTTGSVKVKGRVASLLEVGTGFHPELTGRENIFLNGAILGMRKAEIKKHFDAIVDFAGIERYIDTPVKRYSSGMYVRLAFAVAAHLESEILVVDEVLAVGDAEFQKKCLGKMNAVSKGEGRTVLFVSHNMAAVKSLCNKGFILKNGLLQYGGNVNEAIKNYLSNDGEVKGNKKLFDSSYHFEIFNLNEICLQNNNANFLDPLVEDKEIELHTIINFKTENPEKYNITYHLYNELGENMFSFSNSLSTQNLRKGENRISCIFPANFFQSGNFSLAIFIVEDSKSLIFTERDIITFTVVNGQRKPGVYMGREPGYIRPQFNWKNNYDTSN